MQYASRTETGRRLRNEDNCYIPRSEDRTPLVAVADGMGGHAAGVRASTLAIGGIMERIAGRVLSDDAADAILHAVEQVNLSIYRHAQEEEGCRGMGTTLTLAVLQEGEYIAASVGDSRLYQFDGQTLSQITTDHSLVAVLVSRGAITAAEAAHHPQRNIITRALGTSAYEEIDIFRESWKPGDILLLSSDGLHGVLSDEKMAEILRRDVPLQEACDALVELALQEGSMDNVTAVLVRLEGGDPA